MNYGIPYMGSKSKICKHICRLFPNADNFYDIFGGGFSITHFMLKHRSKDYKEFHFNELRPGVCELIKDAISGKYSYENYKPEWISRDEFLKRKDTDAFVKIVWSFGNSGKYYLFGKDIESYKKSMHNAIVFNKFDDLAKKIFGMDKFRDGFSITDKRLLLRNRVVLLNKGKLRGQLQQLQQLQQLERLQQLQQLERLQQLNFYNLNYQDVPIKENSVIYCDPPYNGTDDYGSNFNTEKFLDWANGIDQPVFISEYNIKDDRFKNVFNIDKKSLLSATENRLVKNEKVYLNRAGINLLLKNKPKHIEKCNSAVL